MARVNFTGLAGNISDLNANFTQLYSLRELISDAGYTAATPKFTIDASGNIVWTSTGNSSTGVVNFSFMNTGQRPFYVMPGLGSSAVFGVAIGFGATAKSDTAAGTLTLPAGIGMQGGGLIVGAYAGTLNFHTFNVGAETGGSTTLDASRAFEIDSSGNARVVKGSLGYGTGSGGAVTQATSKSTGVTLNKSNGAITLNAASLAATTSVAFTLTNSTIAATDVVHVSIKSGATANSYFVSVDATAAGSCSISLRNYTGGALAEAVVLNFVIIKAVVA